MSNDRKLSFSNSSFQGNLVQGDTSGNIQQQVNQSNCPRSTQEQELKEILVSIEKILKSVESGNTELSTDSKVESVSDETSVNFKKRAVELLKIIGDSALDRLIDTPYSAISRIILQKWKEIFG